MNKSDPRATSGFTIVELLVVIVVIGILAAITIVAYTGISQKAISASLQSDLTNASTQLKTFYVTNSAYPLTSNCSIAESSTNICLKSSSSNALTYTPINSSNPQAFHLTNTNSTTSYTITDNSTPYLPITCLAGYIVVPGNSTYGTNDFCVMKYEAKNVAGVATSQAASTPWVSISQTSAITTSAAACTGCHLITEGEWLTIAQNVLNVNSNWDNGAGTHTIGTGYIYSGHGDNAPANALDADTNDSNGYYGTGNTAPSNQKRTLALSNGEVIWDLAGNVWELTQGSIDGGLQPGLSGEVAYAWKQWNNGSLLQNGLPNNAMPRYTGISGASGWGGAYGIGQLSSNYGEATARVYIRGGSYSVGTGSGVYGLRLQYTSSNTSSDFGFRVSQ